MSFKPPVLPAIFRDNGSASAIAGSWVNNTGSAHVSSTLAKFELLNATDTSKVITVANAGSGNAIDITQKDGAEMVSLKFDATQANVTAADVFAAFKSTSGTEASIAGTAVAGVIAYNTFTGSHWTRVIEEDRTDLQANMLLEIVNERPDINGKNQLFSTRICKAKGSKKAVGVYGGTDRDGNDLVLSIGTGYIMVANKGVNVEIGDFLISSDVRGCAERQEDDIYSNLTVAKATEDIVWNGEEAKLISCIYLGG